MIGKLLEEAIDFKRREVRSTMTMPKRKRQEGEIKTEDDHYLRTLSPRKVHLKGKGAHAENGFLQKKGCKGPAHQVYRGTGDTVLMLVCEKATQGGREKTKWGKKRPRC